MAEFDTKGYGVDLRLRLREAIQDGRVSDEAGYAQLQKQYIDEDRASGRMESFVRYGETDPEYWRNSMHEISAEGGVKAAALKAAMAFSTGSRSAWNLRSFGLLDNDPLNLLIDKATGNRERNEAMRQGYLMSVEEDTSQVSRVGQKILSGISTVPGFVSPVGPMGVVRTVPKAIKGLRAVEGGSRLANAARKVGAGALGFGVYDGLLKPEGEKIGRAIGLNSMPDDERSRWEKFYHGAKMGAFAEVIGPLAGGAAKLTRIKNPYVTGAAAAFGTGYGIGAAEGGLFSEDALASGLSFMPLGLVNSRRMFPWAGLPKVSSNFDKGTFAGRDAKRPVTLAELETMVDPAAVKKTMSEKMPPPDLPTVESLVAPDLMIGPKTYGEWSRQIQGKTIPEIDTVIGEGLAKAEYVSNKVREISEPRKLPESGDWAERLLEHYEIFEGPKEIGKGTPRSETPVQEGARKTRQKSERVEAKKVDPALMSEGHGDSSYTSMVSGKRALHMEPNPEKYNLTEVEANFVRPNPAELADHGVTEIKIPEGTFRYRDPKQIEALVNGEPDLVSFRGRSIKTEKDVKKLIEDVHAADRMGALLEYGRGNYSKEGATASVTGRDAFGREIATVLAKNPDAAAQALKERHGAVTIDPIKPAGQGILDVTIERSMKGSSSSKVKAEKALELGKIPEAKGEVVAGVLNERITTRAGAERESKAKAYKQTVSRVELDALEAELQRMVKNPKELAKKHGLKPDDLAHALGFELMARRTPDAGFYEAPAMSVLFTEISRTPAGKINETQMKRLRQLERTTAIASLPAEGALKEVVETARSKVRDFMATLDGSRDPTVLNERLPEAMEGEIRPGGRQQPRESQDLTKREIEAIEQASKLDRSMLKDIIRRSPLPKADKESIGELPLEQMSHRQLDTIQDTLLKDLTEMEIKFERANTIALAQGIPRTKLESSINGLRAKAWRIAGEIENARPKVSEREETLAQMGLGGDGTLNMHGGFPYESIVEAARGIMEPLGSLARERPAILRVIEKAESVRDMMRDGAEAFKPAFTRIWKWDPELFGHIGRALGAVDGGLTAAARFDTKLKGILRDPWQYELFFRKLVSDQAPAIQSNRGTTTNIPRLNPRQETLYRQNHDRVFRHAEEFYKKEVLPYVESFATDAGISVDPKRGGGMYIKLLPMSQKTAEAHAKSKGGILANANGTFDAKVNIPNAGVATPQSRASTAARGKRAGASRQAKGSAEWYALDGRELLEHMILDRKVKAEHNRLRRELKRAAFDPRTHDVGDLVEIGGAREPLKRIELGRDPAMLDTVRRRDYLSEAELQAERELDSRVLNQYGDALVPASVAEAWQAQTVKNKSNRLMHVWREVLNFQTTAMLATGGEGLFHTFNVLGYLSVQNGIGPSRLSRLMAYTPLRVASVVHEMWNLRGPEAESLFTELAENARVRSSYFKESDHIIDKIWGLKEVKDFVFGMPDFSGPGLRGIETRARVAMLKVLRRVDPSITIEEAAIAIDGGMGGYVQSLASPFVRALRATGLDSFAAAGMAGFRSAYSVASLQGTLGVTRGAKAGRKMAANELIMSTVTFAMGVALYQKALDPLDRWPWEIPGKSMDTIRISKDDGTPSVDIPVSRLFSNPLYRALHHTGLREMSKEATMDPEDPNFYRRIQESWLRGVGNSLLGRLGPVTRGPIALLTGKVPYLTSSGNMMDLEQTNQNINPLVSRAKGVAASVFPQYGEMVHEIAQRPGGTEVSSADRLAAFFGLHFPKPGKYSELSSQGKPARARKGERNDIISSVAWEALNYPSDQLHKLVVTRLRERLPPAEVGRSVPEVYKAMVALRKGYHTSATKLRAMEHARSQR